MAGLVNEIPSGAIDGVNTTYTVSVPYSQGSMRAYVNGALLPELTIDDSGFAGGVFIITLDAGPLVAPWRLECVFIDPLIDPAESGACPITLTLVRETIDVEISTQEIDLELETIDIDISSSDETTIMIKLFEPLIKLDHDQTAIDLEVCQCQ